jgi:ABC-type polysaccharide/polyol phosphate transport system ATPase subunit
MKAIELNHLSKKYNLYRSTYDRFKEALHPFRKTYHNSHYVIKDISLSINEGDVLGIIGKNGCGKSTLLKILAGVLTQSEGQCIVKGKVSALLELGSGFNPEYTGIENIYFSASLMGFSNKEIKDKLQDIIDFADIGEYIHQPVKTYSSGMSVRLAFAVSVNIDPDILIIDEALSVGDIRFQQKSLRKMKDLMHKAKAIIFVTHDMGAVLNLCNRVIWLKDGEIFQEGTPDEVCKDYISFMSHNQISNKSHDLELNYEDIPDTSEYLCHIDHISLGTKFLKIEGWCMNPEIELNNKTKLLFKNNNSQVVFSTDVIKRVDVTNTFNQKGYNYDNSGFVAFCSRESFVENQYDMYLLIDENNTLSKKFIESISLEQLQSNIIKESYFDIVDTFESFGSKDAEIIGVRFKDSLSGDNISVLKGGETVDYFVKIKTNQLINNPILGIIIKNNYGIQIIGINTYIYNQNLELIEKDKEVVVRINFRIPLLKEGVYTISPAISNGIQDNHIVLHWIHDATVFEIRTNDVRQKIGVIYAPEEVIIEVN